MIWLNSCLEYRSLGHVPKIHIPANFPLRCEEMWRNLENTIIILTSFAADGLRSSPTPTLYLQPCTITISGGFDRNQLLLLNFPLSITVTCSVLLISISWSFSIPTGSWFIRALETLFSAIVRSSVLLPSTNEEHKEGKLNFMIMFSGRWIWLWPGLVYNIRPILQCVGPGRAASDVIWRPARPFCFFFMRAFFL